MEHRNYKFRLYPSNKQVGRLYSQFDLCCELYNTLLERCKIEYETNGTSLNSKAKLCQIIKEVKDSDPKFRVVFSQTLQNC
ncbi:MAG: helix-turn-helix domain-containing protein, partial [Candidatus Altiarchaeota archaeon]|nr:helix-turn-helix domain-containing protein [Candidatus Altiarchaeota archaeon]